MKNHRHNAPDAPATDTEALEELEHILSGVTSIDSMVLESVPDETQDGRPRPRVCTGELDPDLTDAGVTASDRANRIKSEGTCPWSGCPCKRAPRCTMTATDACNNLIRRRVKNCGTCSHHGSCDELFICFLDVCAAEAADIAAHK